MTLLSALGYSRYLPPADRYVFRRALLLLPASRAALSLLGFRRALALAGRLGRPKPPPLTTEAETRADHIAQMWQLAANRAGPSYNCLARSVSLWWLLRLNGLTSELQIGVRTEGGKLQAHAWVERRGRPLNDQADSLSQYAAFEGLAVPDAAEWA